MGDVFLFGCQLRHLDNGDKCFFPLTILRVLFDPDCIFIFRIYILPSLRQSFPAGLFKNVWFTKSAS